MDSSQLKEILMKKQSNGRISCQAARKIAEETGTPELEIGRIIDELQLKICACQLGCFK
jgi:hypothetical protein